MIECLLPDRANQAFSIGVLPGRSRCRWPVAKAHRTKPPGECLAINAIAIANDIVRSSLPAAGLPHLPSNPFGRRVCRHPQPHESTSTVTQEQEPIQQPKGKRRHDEQVHRGDTVSMIAKKGPPALRRPSPPPGHVLCNACLANIDAELEQFAMDAGCAP